MYIVISGMCLFASYILQISQNKLCLNLIRERSWVITLFSIVSFPNQYSFASFSPQSVDAVAERINILLLNSSIMMHKWCNFYQTIAYIAHVSNMGGWGCVFISFIQQSNISHKLVFASRSFK